MFNIKKVKRLEAEIKILEELVIQKNDTINTVCSTVQRQRDNIRELQSEIDRLGLYRDSKGRFQSIDKQI